MRMEKCLADRFGAQLMSDDGLNFGMSDGRIVITERFRVTIALGEANPELRFLTDPEKVQYTVYPPMLRDVVSLYGILRVC